MAVMLERWNDDKMDALDAKVGGTAERVVVLEVKVDALDTKVDGVATELGEQRREMNARFDALNRTLLTVLVGVPAAYAILSQLFS
jgi:hypothetical protein